MKLERISIAFLMVLLTLAILPSSQAAQGPREDELQMRFYSNVLNAYTALETGEIDIVGFDIQEPVYIDAIANPNVALGAVDDMGMYELDLNNNYTIGSVPGWRSPTNYLEMRQAVAFCTDKDLVVDTYCGGFAARIDQPIAPPTAGWMNASYTGANYPYEYDPEAASDLLTASGWVEGTTPNPDYDPAFPGSTEYIRQYPTGHTKAGQDMDPLKVYVRTDDPRRFQAGRHMYGNLKKIGVAVEALEGPSSYTYDPVMGLRDYHIYTGGWGLGRFPTYVYFFFHTDYNVPYGNNYLVGFEADGSPNHPLLNDLVEAVYYAGSYNEALANCQLAMGLFTELCVNVPLFGARSYWVYSTDLLGAVNEESYAFENTYFFMNVYRPDGLPLKWGHVTPPNQLNIIYSSWTYDYQCLERVYDYPLMDVQPYNIVKDQSAHVLDWTVELWDDGGTNKTKVTRSYRSDGYFCEALSGAQLEVADADAVLFSNYFLYAAGVDAWQWSTVQDVKYFNKLGDYELEIYFDAESYWLYTSASPPLLPMSQWLNTTKGLTTLETEVFVVGTNLTTPGPLGLTGPVWVNSIVSDLDGTLTEWVDYRWELGDYTILSTLTNGAVVTVEYYAIADASGYTVGDLPWQEITMGNGMYYATGFSPGAGGFFTAMKNPFYYMETPILGEIDFVWETGGYYEVTIFDVVKAAGAYGSQGTAVPDSNWVAGADLAPPGGVIDIFDIVTIAGKYGQTSGTHTYP
jgi:hypothetical protein